MMDNISSYIVHAALGIVAVIMLPIAIVCVPFWLIGKALGAWMTASDEVRTHILAEEQKP